MAQLQVKPTRMELTNLKKKRKVAARGHKLMKDKRDEMVRRFIAYARRNKELREQVEQKLSAAMGQFVLARAEMSGEAIEEALAYPARPATVSVDTQHVLSLKMPKLSLETSDTFDYPYGFMNTSAELDSAVSAFADSYGRQQWGILDNGGNPDPATPREGRRFSDCKPLLTEKKMMVSV